MVLIKDFFTFVIVIRGILKFKLLLNIKSDFKL